MVKQGLGRGLSSLIPALKAAKDKLQEIRVEEISPRPNQPRRDDDPEAFAELVASIKELGLVQPVVVRPKALGFELVAGERRWKAAKEAGLTHIPAIVKSPSEEEALQMALVENLQREDLNAIEEATAYEQLIKELGVTQADLAKRIGKSRTAIANTLRLLQLPERVKNHIIEGNLSSGHARALLSLKDEKKQRRLAEHIIKENLSVRQTERVVYLSRIASLPKKGEPFQPEIYQRIAAKLTETLSAKVKVKGRARRGKIEISFESVDDLERIFRILTKKRK